MYWLRCSEFFFFIWGTCEREEEILLHKSWKGQKENYPHSHFHFAFDIVSLSLSLSLSLSFSHSQRHNSSLSLSLSVMHALHLHLFSSFFLSHAHFISLSCKHLIFPLSYSLAHYFSLILLTRTWQTDADTQDSGCHVEKQGKEVFLWNLSCNKKVENICSTLLMCFFGYSEFKPSEL